MGSIKSRHGLGNESAPWGNEVTDSLNNGLERTRLLRDSVDRSLSMGAKSFTQAGNRRQELEQAWTPHSLSVSTVTSQEDNDIYFPFSPIQGPEWANWAVIPSFSLTVGSPGPVLMLSSNGRASFDAVWGAALVVGVNLISSVEQAGNLIPVRKGLLDLGWFTSYGMSGTVAYSLEIVVNWIR